MTTAAAATTDPRGSNERASRGRHASRRALFIGAALVLTAELTACTTLGTLSPNEDTRARARQARHRSQLLEASNARKAASERSPREHKTAAELIAEGDRYRAAGNFSHAAVSYLRAHHIDEAALTPLRRIAYLALESEPGKAARLFDELLSEHPNEADLHLGLAMAKLGDGDREAALDSALRASDLAPDDALVLDSLALVYDQLGRHAEARDVYQRAVEASDGAPGPLNNLGVSQLLAGDYRAASHSFERAIERGATSPAVRNNLGLALGLAGHIREAFVQFSAAGTKGDAFNNLGLALFLRGDYDAARNAYAQALLAGDTDEERVLRNLARLESVTPR